MRHLHARDGACRGEPARAEPEAGPRRHSRGPCRKSLPLHGLRPHLRGGCRRRRRGQGRMNTSTRFARSAQARCELHAAIDLTDTLTRLAAEPGTWRLFAGGTDLMVLLEAQRLPPGRYLSIWGLPELRGIDVGSETIAIGALTTYTEILQHKELSRDCPLLVAAAG